MFDIETRRRLAEEIVDACCEPGALTPAALAERAAGRLDPRPRWLDELTGQLAAGVRRAGGTRRGGAPSWTARRRLVHQVERFLVEHRPKPGEAVAPRLVRDVAGHVAVERLGTLAHGWPIAAIESLPAFADELELSDGQLAWLADVRGLERRAPREALRNYRYRWVPRRSGLPRLIEAPKLRLKEVQRWILAEILDAVPPHPAAHGFRRGHSVIGHAAAHAGAPAVLRLDLRDFFASVPAGRVFGIFRTLGYDPPIAHLLTGLTTNTTALVAWEALPPSSDGRLLPARFHLGRRLATPHLPQGAPSSPALANLAAFGLDRRLSGLAAAAGLTYTRYADDLTLSGPELGHGARARAIARTIAAIAREEGFSVHSGKTTLRTAARRQLVTGIVVNAHPNLARDEYDRLRALLHRAALDGPRAVELPVGVDARAHLGGRVAWAESLNPRRGAKLRRRFEQIDWGAG